MALGDLPAFLLLTFHHAAQPGFQPLSWGMLGLEGASAGQHSSWPASCWPLLMSLLNGSCPRNWIHTAHRKPLHVPGLPWLSHTGQLPCFPVIWVSGLDFCLVCSELIKPRTWKLRITLHRGFPEASHRGSSHLWSPDDIVQAAYPSSAPRVALIAPERGWSREGCFPGP